MLAIPGSMFICLHVQQHIVFMFWQSDNGDMLILGTREHAAYTHTHIAVSRFVRFASQSFALLNRFIWGNFHLYSFPYCPLNMHRARVTPHIYVDLSKFVVASTPSLSIWSEWMNEHTVRTLNRAVECRIM